MSLKPRAVDFEETWNKNILPIVQAVLKHDRVPRAAWNECHTSIYTLCSATPPHSSNLYTQTKAFLEAHVKHLYQEITGSSDVQLMYHKYWEEYTQGVKYLNTLYSFLNNVKGTDEPDDKGETKKDIGETKKDIGDLALEIWNGLMFEPLVKGGLIKDEDGMLKK